jgi:hypothetical protein
MRISDKTAAKIGLRYRRKPRRARQSVRSRAKPARWRRLSMAGQPAFFASELTTTLLVSMYLTVRPRQGVCAGASRISPRLSFSPSRLEDTRSRLPIGDGCSHPRSPPLPIGTVVALRRGHCQGTFQ